MLQGASIAANGLPSPPASRWARWPEPTRPLRSATTDLRTLGQPAAAVDTALLPHWRQAAPDRAAATRCRRDSHAERCRAGPAGLPAFRHHLGRLREHGAPGEPARRADAGRARWPRHAGRQAGGSARHGHCPTPAEHRADLAPGAWTRLASERRLSADAPLRPQAAGDPHRAAAAQDQCPGGRGLRPRDPKAGRAALVAPALSVDADGGAAGRCPCRRRAPGRRGPGARASRSARAAPISSAYSPRWAFRDRPTSCACC